MMRFAVDPWVSDFAPPTDPDAELPPTSVEANVEVPLTDWAPITPPPRAPFTTIRFVDGVQSTDAMIAIDGTDGTMHAGLVGSWAAGTVTWDGTAAHVDTDTARVLRGVFCAAEELAPIAIGGVTWDPYRVATDIDADLSNALRRTRSELERGICLNVPRDPDAVLVIDGPMHEMPRSRTPWAVGMAKRIHRHYLPADQRRILRELATGQRTPLFRLGGEPRWSWYVCLDDLTGFGTSQPAGLGVVRMETDVTGATPMQDVAAFADRVTASIPRFATRLHEDRRAPANLRPIKALETHLKRHLGSKEALRRLLLTAAGQSRTAP